MSRAGKWDILRFHPTEGSQALQKTDDTTITLKDVASASGFSPATVSMVLNDAPLARYIPLETKTHIRKMAKKLGYRPNAFARSLRQQRSHTVGVLVCDLTDPYCTLILRGVESALSEATYLPIFTDFRNEPARFESHLEMLLDRRVEGLIVVANWLFLDINLLSDLEKGRVPTTIIGRTIEKLSSVIVDNEAGAKAALEHLHSLGHRKIAFVRGPKAVVDSGERWAGIESAAKGLRIALDPRLIVDLPESQEPMAGFEWGSKLTTELVDRKRPFTALVAFDDMTAFGAIRALSRAGIRVPDQCSVVGFDDVPAAALYSPSLTTVRQPMQSMGSAAVEILLAELRAAREHAKLPQRTHTAVPELVLRESTSAVG
jgi:LacI family transcriptional regulator